MIAQATHTGGDRAGSVFRLYMGGNSLVTWYLTLCEPRSMLNLLKVSTASMFLTWCLLVVGLAAIADAAINDFMPNKYNWKLALTQRHFILSALAFCYVAQLFVAYPTLRSSGLLAYYLWNAGSLVFISFVDAHQRSKDATCVVISN